MFVKRKKKGKKKILSFIYVVHKLLRMFLVSSHCRVHLIVKSRPSFISLPKAGCFEYKIVFNGMGFPPNGPVMQKKTVKWEPSTEMMYMCGGELKGDVNMALLLEDGSHHRCDFKSTYK